jgi:peroxisomal trans-2-enoyl-CoA reductase
MSKPWKSCFRDGLLEGKVALVTGGGTGIGLSIATELASLGAIVVIASRNRQTCQEAADRMNATQVSGKIVAGPSTSIRKEDEVRNLIAWVLESFDALHLLVNNAGGQFISAAEDISKGGFSAVVETNLTGTFLVCREAFTQYMDKHGGAIVNITLGNRNGMPMMSHSGASRAGVENLTATLSTEWMESNVRVNCVRPGIIWTESGFENYGPAGEMFVERLLPAMPARRFGSPEEVSSAVVWLLSEGASYVTGTVLNVDGASAYTLLPLRDIEDKEHLPFYGTLPRKARL